VFGRKLDDAPPSGKTAPNGAMIKSGNRPE
jgi:hypothetical protein